MENMIETIETDTITVTSSDVVTAPKTKTQRTYHIHAKGDKTNVFTVIVLKGILYCHPDVHSPECNSITFTPVPKGDSQTDSNGGVWVQINDPRK